MRIPLVLQCLPRLCWISKLIPYDETFDLLICPPCLFLQEKGSIRPFGLCETLNCTIFLVDKGFNFFILSPVIIKPEPYCEQKCTKYNNDCPPRTEMGDQKLQQLINRLEYIRKLFR